MNNNYVPLYRKYRPQKLEEVVGQEHIKKALTNAIESDRISHAYLFTGPRGTGKTSTARIFAKSLNCEKGPTVSPCNECENCINITKSVPIDVIEMDAASNRSVNDAEEIIQNVAMAPVHSRYKIYIIDEVHMLTPTAFNALLKTLEEPPENVIFILATTEVHKVLDTIKSRCQRFDFKRITTDDITKHLRFISDKEKINITDEALRYIATNSAGGMRDSIALLDQLSILNSADKKIETDDINRLLGRLSFGSLTTLFENIIKSDGSASLNTLNDIYNQGNEPSQILSNFLEYLRNALIIKTTGIKDVTDAIQLNEEQIKTLCKDLDNIEAHQLISLSDKCASYIRELKLTTNPKLWLDIAILDMANLTENTKLEDLQKRISSLESGNIVKPAPSYNTPPMPVNKYESVENSKQHPPVQKQSVPKQTVQESKPAPAQPSTIQSAGTSGDLKAVWEKFLESISSFPSRAILKQQAIPVKITQDEIIITIKNTAWLKSFSIEGERFAFLEESAKTLFGKLPKIVVRAPQAGDDKIRAEQNPSSEQKSEVSPKPPLIPKTQETKEEITEAIELSKDEEKKTINNSSEEETNSPDAEPPSENNVAPAQSRADASYHSDEVNMVVDLFEGKIIE